MPTVTKETAPLKRQSTPPVTAPAARDRRRVPTADRRAGRRSGMAEEPTKAADTELAAEKVAVLPPAGTSASDAPTRLETHCNHGDKGRTTMRIVALDLGAKKITYCEVANGQVVERATASEVTSLQSLLGPEAPAARVAIEACREAWYVYDLLVEWGNDVVLVDTTRCRQLGIGQHQRKTDRIDAEALARALEAGRIPQAHVLSPRRRELRRVLGVRRALVESRAQLVTTMRGLVREQGGRLPGCNTSHFVDRVRKLALAPELVDLLGPLLGLVEQINAGLERIEGQLASLCEQEPIVAALTTTPGVGTVVAACFVSVVDEARRFHSAHHIESYVGLVPSEKTTGGKRRLGAISKQGNSYLRTMLVQAAWSIVSGKDKADPLYLWATQVAKRRGKRVAVVALARRLVGVLWAMWRDGTVYDREHLAQQGIRGLKGAVQTLEHRTAALAQAAKKPSVKKAPNASSATPRRSRKTSAAKAA